MPHKRSARKEINRIEHKQARAAERQALEGGHLRVVHGMGWGTKIPQPPLMDDKPVRHPGKKSGCKRNKGGPHDYEVWPDAPTSEIAWNEEGKFWESKPIPWSRRRYHPPYRCKRCKKGFYRNAKIEAQLGLGRALADRSAEHWTYAHIQERLLGGQDACTCPTCKE